MIFRMTRALAAELPKPLDIVKRHRELTETLVLGINRLDAGEIKYRVEQHRGVAVGQHEAVPIGPNRILWVKSQKILPNCVNQRRQSHWRARMARFRLL